MGGQRRISSTNVWTVAAAIAFGSLTVGMTSVGMTSVGAHEDVEMMSEAEMSEAGRVSYDFIINVTAGPLADNTYEGSFSYDPSAVVGEGVEEIRVDDGLEASINFYGEDFVDEDDSDYPDYPRLVFEDGEIQVLDFWVEEGDRLIWWNTPGWEVELIPVEGGVRSGR